MKNFKKLKIWQQGMDIVAEVYKLTKNFPSEERFGLASQMNRAAISIPSNISEGSSRGSAKEHKYFIQIALGSCFELETQLLIAERIDLSNSTLDMLKQMIDEEQKMLMSFMKKL
ncbi:four helix bundle protein [Fulvivirga sp. RKSG066]|uniref:four helix bundle protein n=1 Tax=Fulvivirga aurantia TaxID=2529383 RepID=UPI0012BD6378|nr:four helix bundle protein [Fulvivirga aurantia]MTI22314.1 four helix bundle protein [Fulvivirga aurantia]